MRGQETTWSMTAFITPTSAGGQTIALKWHGSRARAREDGNACTSTCTHRSVAQHKTVIGISFRIAAAKNVRTDVLQLAVALVCEWRGCQSWSDGIHWKCLYIVKALSKGSNPYLSRFIQKPSIRAISWLKKQEDPQRMASSFEILAIDVGLKNDGHRFGKMCPENKHPRNEPI